MKNRNIVIGTRGSELALWQTNHIRDRIISNNPGIEITVEVIKTKGDIEQEAPLSKFSDKGLFTKEIENALLDKKIDLAVHSLKDLQTEIPGGLAIGAYLTREKAEDVFISEKYSSIDELPPGARVATGSLRRRSQLLAYRSDIKTVDIRGNVPTRIKKMQDEGYDGLILAYAGIHRLGMDSFISQVIPVDVMIPAVCQGILSVEIREDDDEMKELLAPLNDTASEIPARAERSFLKNLQGGCQAPIGGYAVLVAGENLMLNGMVGSPDGKILKGIITEEANNPESLGKKLAEKLKERGAEELLRELRDI